MAVLASDIKYCKPSVISDSASNGGHRTYDFFTASSLQNVFPNVYSEERNAGSTKYRFIYPVNHNTSNEEGVNTKCWIDKETPGGDYIYFVPVAKGTIQSGITGSEEKFTVLPLSTNINISGTSFIGNFPVAALSTSIAEGDLLLISNKTSPTSLTGTAELVTVVGTPVVAGTQVTFNFTPAVQNAYTTVAGTRASKIYEPGSMVASIGTLSKSSATGFYDDGNYPIVPDNLGSVKDTFTITFSSATNFACTGARTGLIGSGVRSTNFAPNNPLISRPYFTIPSGFWTGTWTNGDTLTIPVEDSAFGICEVRVVPAGAATYTSNGTSLVVSVESA